jgi:hypothetical protein
LMRKCCMVLSSCLVMEDTWREGAPGDTRFQHPISAYKKRLALARNRGVLWYYL